MKKNLLLTMILPKFPRQFWDVANKPVSLLGLGNWIISIMLFIGFFPWLCSVSMRNIKKELK